MKQPLGGLAAAATVAAFASHAHADITLPRLISEGMVLQRGTPIRLWGIAAPGEVVTAQLAGRSATATAAADGRWELRLPKQPAGGPYTLTIAGKNTVTIPNVLIGEVWVCSGQSNMEWPLAASANAAQEVAAASDPLLRMFTVSKAIARTPQSDVTGGTWQSALPENAGGFSAVGYYFARKLRQVLGVPVGIIHTSWGGTRIEAWTERAVLERLGEPETQFTWLSQTPPGLSDAKARWHKARAAWQAAGSPTGPAPDTGRAAGWERAQNADFDDSSWGTVRVPGAWEQAGVPALEYLDGVVWLRTTVDVPAAHAGKAAVLSLGAIDDADETFVNGTPVGAVTPGTPDSWQLKRRYAVRPGVLKAGRNTIAVRVWDGQGEGGIIGPDLSLATEDGSWKAPLAGGWRFGIEQSRLADPGPEPGSNDPNAATALYNAMLAPVTPYTIMGALWYQGESNAGDAAGYRKKLPAMIANWRAAFGIPNFPFLVVQLAPFMAISDQPEDPAWAHLRESQRQTALTEKNVGLAVITDVGDEADIHPRQKGPVGERLGLLALKIAYRKPGVAEGPVLSKAEARGATISLHFTSVGKALLARTRDSAGRPVAAGRLVGFAVAGDDGKFVWADARIVGKDRIEVASPQVPRPTRVRFGWANYPIVNLANDAGLLASPFEATVR
jgi:sialate O-acetylesterase